MKQLIELQNTLPGINVALFVASIATAPVTLLFGVQLVCIFRAEGLGALETWLSRLSFLGLAYMPIYGVSQLVIAPTRYSLVDYHEQAYYGLLAGLAIDLAGGIALYLSWPKTSAVPRR